MTQPLYAAVIDSPFGRLGISIDGDAVTSIDPFVSARIKPPRSPLAKRVCRELRAYFKDPCYPFDVPLRLEGTVFQQRVWRALQAIPSGDVKSYGALARRLRSSPRAVGGACRANPVPIIVPCHRVVAQAGLGGYMGQVQGRGVDMKRWLLAHERR